MLFKSIIQEALCSFVSAKMRTALALIGIIIGIGAMTGTNTIGKIIQADTARRFKEMGTDLLSVEFGFKGTEFDGSIEDLLKIPNKCNSVACVAPYIMRTGVNEIFYRGKIIQPVDVVGVTQTLADLGKFKIQEGRVLSDLDAYRDYCYIGAQIQNELKKLGATNLIGEKIKVGKRIFTIIGLIDSKLEGGILQFNANQSIFLHATSAQKLSNKGFYSAIVRIIPGISSKEGEKHFRDYLEKNIKIKTINIISPEELIIGMDEQQKQIAQWCVGIGLITIFLGTVTIMNVMLMSVSQRQQEIGIRRALGSKRWQILSQFLLESILLTFLGGGFGFVLGLAIGFIFSQILQMQFLFSYTSILMAIICSALAGIISGFYPACKAARLDPIVAIRAE